MTLPNLIGDLRALLITLYYYYYLKKKFYVHNIFTIILQQIQSDKLLLVVIGKQKGNFNGGHKLRTSNNWSLKICCEIVVKVTLLIIIYLFIFYIGKTLFPIPYSFLIL